MVHYIAYLSLPVVAHIGLSVTAIPNKVLPKAPETTAPSCKFDLSMDKNLYNSFLSVPIASTAPPTPQSPPNASPSSPRNLTSSQKTNCSVTASLSTCIRLRLASASRVLVSASSWASLAWRREEDSVSSLCFVSESARSSWDSWGLSHLS